MRSTRLVAGLFLVTLLAPAASAAPSPRVGDRVLAQWAPNAWYPGKVDRACEGGLHVAFDDGDQACISVEGLMAVNRRPASGDVSEGTRVAAMWTDGRYYPATVAEVLDHGLRVRFDDHATRRVLLSEVRPIAGPDHVPPPAEGTVVWAQWKPNSWYRGTTGAPCPGGVLVNFDDGDKACVAPPLIADAAPPSEDHVEPGARVLAIWSNGRLFPGTVIGIRRDGRHLVRFDDRAQAPAAAYDLRPMR